MICFLICRGYAFTLKPLKQDPNAPEIRILTYSKALRETALPKATYIFVDLDRLCTAELIAAGRLFRRLAAGGCRVLNDPACVRTRLPLLKDLYRRKLNGFNVFSVDNADKPKRFPVFVRVADDHEGPLTELIEDQRTLERAIEALIRIGYARSKLMIAEYAAEPVRPGVFRKLSVFRVADRYLPHVCVHDLNWVIKAGRSGAAPAELYDEELEILRTNPFAKQLKPAFEIANIDFGRADFSFVKSQLCVYEINTNPTLARPSSHTFAQRIESMEIWWERFLAALHAIDDRFPPGLKIDVSSDDDVTLLEALDMYPRIKGGFLRLSEIYSRRDDRYAAIKYAETAMANAPYDVRLMRQVSKLIADNGNLDRAIEIANHALESDSHNFELLVHRGRLLARAKRYTDAVEAVERAVRLRPQDVRSYRARSEIYWLLGDLRAALSATGEAIRLVGKKQGTFAVKQLVELRAQRRVLHKEIVRQWLHKILPKQILRWRWKDE